MSYMMDCASGLTAARREQIQREAKGTLLEELSNYPFPDICEEWKAPDLGDAFRSPVRSDVPVLFISGTLDARTPVSNAEEYRAGFTNSTHLIIEGEFTAIRSFFHHQRSRTDWSFERGAGSLRRRSRCRR